MLFCLLPLLPKIEFCFVNKTSIADGNPLVCAASSGLTLVLSCSYGFFFSFLPSSRGKRLLPTRNSLLRDVLLSSGPRFVQKVFRLLVLSLYCRQAPLLCNVVPLLCLFFRCTFCVLSLVFRVFVLRTHCRQKPPFFEVFHLFDPVFQRFFRCCAFPYLFSSF